MGTKKNGMVLILWTLPLVFTSVPTEKVSDLLPEQLQTMCPIITFSLSCHVCIYGMLFADRNARSLCVVCQPKLIDKLEIEDALIWDNHAPHIWIHHGATMYGNVALWNKCAVK